MLPQPTPPEEYGLPKEDLLEQADPETEVIAEEYESLAVDSAAMTLTAAKAIVHVDADAVSPAILDHAETGNAVTVAVSRLAQGEYEVEWDSFFEDMNPTVSRRLPRELNLKFAKACIAQNVPGTCTVVLLGSYIVDVYVFDKDGNPADYDFVLVVY